ncbi:hypothetical protein [Staphylococcus shinii]|uniref:hypothetical protein n=1 Tax=Staphylococcus shinii TaxID=2912228 RepID=UPI003F560AD2
MKYILLKGFLIISAILLLIYYYLTAILWVNYLLFGIFSSNYSLILTVIFIILTTISFLIIIPICIIWTSTHLVKKLNIKIREGIGNG